MRLKNRIVRNSLIFVSFLLLAFLPTNADYTINVMTGLMDYYEPGFPAGGAAGGLVYYDGANWQTLAVGANGLVLTVVAGTPAWAASAGAPVGAQYLTLANDAVLTAERQMLAGTGISFTDTGANGTLTIWTQDGQIDHDSLLNYVAGQHLVLPGTIAAVLTDHNLAAHTALGLYDQDTDVDHDQTTNYVAGQHLALPNTIVTVLTDHNLAAHVALGIIDMANVFYISATGGDYATIQAALTAQNAGGEIFIVGPGTYAADTINFSAANQTVRGYGLTPNVHVTQADATVCNFGAWTGCRLENMHLEMTAPTTAKDLVTGSGLLRMRWVHLEVTNVNVVTADQPTCLDTTGNVRMTFGTIEYANTGNDGGGGTAIKAAVRISGAAFVDFWRTNFVITGAGQSLAITPVYGTAGDANITRCEINVDDDASTNTIGFAYSNIVGATHEMLSNRIRVDNANNAAHGLFLLSTETVRSMYNHLHVTSAGGTAVSATTAAGTTWISQFDDIIAANGSAAGGAVNMVSSEADGDLTVSGLTASHPVFTDASDVLVSTGTMPVDQGGTNMTVYTIGDILYASAAGILSGLADVAVNQVLVSGGVGVAPAWSGTPTVASITTTAAGTIGTNLEVNQAFTFDAFQTALGDGDTTIDWGLGNMMYFTFGASNEIIRFTAPPGSAWIHMIAKQDGVGSRTIDWSNVANLIWPGDVEPTLSTGAAAVDILSFIYDGTSWHGLYNGDFR